VSWLQRWAKSETRCYVLNDPEIHGATSGEDTCRYANDDECDVPQYCDSGTDATDCAAGGEFCTPWPLLPSFARWESDATFAVQVTSAFTVATAAFLTLDHVSLSNGIAVGGGSLTVSHAVVGPSVRLALDAGVVSLFDLALPGATWEALYVDLDGADGSVVLSAVTLPENPSWGVLRGTITGGTRAQDPPGFLPDHCAAEPLCAAGRSSLLAFKASSYETGVANLDGVGVAISPSNGAGLEEWRADGDPCADGWVGVSCGGGGAVTRLDLSATDQALTDHDGDTKLTGDIGRLAGLALLVYFDLSDSDVVGVATSLSFRRPSSYFV
jgi:hypothetical protein